MRVSYQKFVFLRGFFFAHFCLKMILQVLYFDFGSRLLKFTKHFLPIFGLKQIVCVNRRNLERFFNQNIVALLTKLDIFEIVHSEIIGCRVLWIHIFPYTKLVYLGYNFITFSICNRHIKRKILTWILRSATKSYLVSKITEDFEVNIADLAKRAFFRSMLFWSYSNSG